MEKKALFLDRDGVINIDTGYVHHINDFHFIDGIFDLCSKAIAKNYLVVVVTNQAGIGRGLYTLNDFNLLTEWMCRKFLENDVIITKVYHSPFHPVHGLGKFKRDDETRKPRPGMINLAAQEYGLCVEKSVLIGDKYTDILAGQNAGIKTNILFAETNESKLNSRYNYHIASTLEEAGYML